MHFLLHITVISLNFIIQDNIITKKNYISLKKYLQYTPTHPTVRCNLKKSLKKGFECKLISPNKF